MNPRSVLTYLALVALSLMAAAAVWSMTVADRLYYCWDSVPLLDFIPPFVHADTPGGSQTGPGFDLQGSSLRDHYIASPWIVFAAWGLFLLIAISVPFLILRRFPKRLPHSQNSQNS